MVEKHLATLRNLPKESPIPAKIVTFISRLKERDILTELEQTLVQEYDARVYSKKTFFMQEEKGAPPQPSVYSVAIQAHQGLATVFIEKTEKLHKTAMESMKLVLDSQHKALANATEREESLMELNRRLNKRIEKLEEKNKSLRKEIDDCYDTIEDLEQDVQNAGKEQGQFEKIMQVAAKLAEVRKANLGD